MDGKELPGLDLIDDGYRALVGALVINHASAVHALQKFTWFLIDPADKRAAQIILGNPSRAQLTDLVKKLLPHRTSDPVILTRAEEILAKLEGVAKTRNDVVHAASLVQMKRGAQSPLDAKWMKILGSTLVKSPNRKQDSYKPVPSRAEIERDSLLARQLSTQLYALETLYMDYLFREREASTDDEPFLPSGDK